MRESRKKAIEQNEKIKEEWSLDDNWVEMIFDPPRRKGSILDHTVESMNRAGIRHFVRKCGDGYNRVEKFGDEVIFNEIQYNWTYLDNNYRKKIMKN